MTKQTLTVRLMHAELRIAELEAQLAAVKDAPTALPQGYDQRPFGYTGQLYVESQMRAVAAKPLAPAPKPKPAYVRAPHVLPAHFAAAKYLAMSTGACVKVEA